MTVICQACRHHPGRGELCPVAHVHATAHPKRCASFVPGIQADRVHALRSAACSLHRLGNQAGYFQVLQAAHREAGA